MAQRGEQYKQTEVPDLGGTSSVAQVGMLGQRHMTTTTAQCDDLVIIASF